MTQTLRGRAFDGITALVDGRRIGLEREVAIDVVDVVAVAAGHVVDAGAAVENVVVVVDELAFIAAVERVFAVPTEQEVIARAAIDVVVAGAAVDVVVVGELHVVRTRAFAAARAVAPIVAAINDVVAVVAIELVAVRAAVDAVVAGAARDEVDVAGQLLDEDSLLQST